mgnify:CR=1 FL=1
MVSRVIPVDPFDLVIFGGTGDLARRKILPGLFRRFCSGQMSSESKIIGAARGVHSAEEFREIVAAAIHEFVSSDAIDESVLAEFLIHVRPRDKTGRLLMLLMGVS